MPDIPFDIGEHVVDREGNVATPLVVVALTTTPADEWIMYGGLTVAQDNPSYPADAPVVIVVDADDINTYLAQWDAKTPLSQTTLDEIGVYYTPAPAPRLISTDPDEDADSETDAATDDM